MAKVRVYELARELNLDSKELVEKLVAGGMNIANYMSTLDESAVRKAKDIVSGSISEVIVEKRIKPTIIRRRKKTVKVEPESPETDDDTAVEAPADTEPSPEEEPLDSAAPTAKEEPDEETAPVEEAPEEPSEGPVEADVPPEEGDEVQAAEPAEEIIDSEAEKEPEEKASKEIPLEEEAPETGKGVKKKAKKQKKRKIEEPAKIIMRPEEGPLKDLLAKKAEEKKAQELEKDLAKKKASTQKGTARKPGIPKAGPSPAEIEDESKKKAKPSRKKKIKKKGETTADQDRDAPRRKRKEVYERTDLYEGRSLRRKDKKTGKKTKEVAKKQTEITVPKARKRRIKVPEQVTMSDLAKVMGVKAVDLMKKLMAMGVMANINQAIDFETASIAADEFGYELELDTFEETEFIEEKEDTPEDLMPRPPVVTIMGHVDHGKTSLLDYIRKSNIAGGEWGGITQHIGAYYVKMDSGDIAFLDTPGHEAFTAMRARGAQVTDIIVLVVAADDGVMPQTKEAINHGRAAEIPIVVGINKMDKPDAEPDKVRRELAELGLSPEEWGGETLFGSLSAKSGEGVDELLSLILLQAEMLELKANPKKNARGTVVEAKLDKSRGPVATVLIKNGTLKQGEFFVCGENYGRVRAMLNHSGQKIDSAGPSVPVEIYGISGVPMAGDEFVAVNDEKTAKQVSEQRKARQKKPEAAARSLVSLDDFYERMKDGEIKELNVVIKADVQGSIEAVTDSLLKQSTDQVRINVIHSATGAVSESDVMLASASNAIIIGFNVRANPRGQQIAEKESVDIRYYDVIYELVKDIRLAMAGLLEPVKEENIIGHTEIKEIFRVPKIGTVAGCQVTDGHVERDSNVRLLRDNVVIYDGRISSLRRFKEDVKEVQTGYECGIGLENYNDIKPGDVFEIYRIKEVKAEL